MRKGLVSMLIVLILVSLCACNVPKKDVPSGDQPSQSTQPGDSGFTPVGPTEDNPNQQPGTGEHIHSYCLDVQQNVSLHQLKVEKKCECGDIILPEYTATIRGRDGSQETVASAEGIITSSYIGHLFITLTVGTETKDVEVDWSLDFPSEDKGVTYFDMKVYQPDPNDVRYDYGYPYHGYGSNTPIYVISVPYVTGSADSLEDCIKALDKVYTDFQVTWAEMGSPDYVIISQFTYWDSNGNQVAVVPNDTYVSNWVMFYNGEYASYALNNITPAGLDGLYATKEDNIHEVQMVINGWS